MDYGRKIKKWGVSVNPGIQASKGVNVNFVDALKNTNNNYSYGFNLGIWYEKEKKFSLNIRPNISRTIAKSSLRPDIVTRYWTQEHEVYLNVFLPWKMEIGSDASFNFRQKTDAFDRNNNSIRWNANIDKKILKNDMGRIRFSAFDILNQNNSFQRNTTSNFISERNYNTFRRYFMLSFIWNFSNNGMKAPGQ
jgi:hypothetical protein